MGICALRVDPGLGEYSKCVSQCSHGLSDLGVVPVRYPRADSALGPRRRGVPYVRLVSRGERVPRPGHCMCSFISYHVQRLMKNTQADAKPVRLVIILLAALHAGIALCFKILFFSYYVVKEVGPGDGPHI